MNFSSKCFPNFPTSSTYRPSYRLAILGILVGLSCLGKYHGFFGLGLIGLFNKSTMLCAAVTLGMAGDRLFVVTIPNVVLEYAHDWVSFRFQSERGPEPVQCAECRAVF